MRFSTEKPVALPDSAGAGNISIGGLQHPLPIALHRGTAYIARPDSMEIASGVRKADPVLIAPKHKPLTTMNDLGAMVGSNPARRPVIAKHEDKTFALSSLIAQVPGSGTTKGHHEVELLVADTDRAAKAWSTRIPLRELEYALDVDEKDTEVVGLYGDTVVLFAQGRLFGVDVNSHQKVWTAPGTYAAGAVLAAGKLVALRDDADGDRQPVGLDPADGHQEWAIDDLAADTLAAASPGTVLVGGYLTSNDDTKAGAVLLEAATNKRLETYDGEFKVDGCDYDGRATTICTGADSIVAYNTQTGSTRWKLPAGNRVAPEVTLVRAGLVYGTTENGPVVLDSTTGADKEDQPGIAPYFSDGYVGIALTESDHTVSAYRIEH
ncbi:PQQ-binding-like beta-propeller repeat protein [Streptomyces aureocirculatus]|uniref:PQQ-binding-like beta-propeller repeat protein n=1 Tax=Streptomyces aureocirculatus TaxID=67275 RepID=UPI0004C51B0C|nr:PQQ-binding-like beta-propeller repeat protein [Streptomyces aureocirculatus]